MNEKPPQGGFSIGRSRDAGPAAPGRQSRHHRGARLGIMKTFIALLRAVNVAGTGKLPMDVLRSMCEQTGFANVRTYIQSGNVVFATAMPANAVQRELAARLQDYCGKPVGGDPARWRADAQRAGAQSVSPCGPGKGGRAVSRCGTGAGCCSGSQGPDGRRSGGGRPEGVHSLSVRHGPIQAPIARGNCRHCAQSEYRGQACVDGSGRKVTGSMGLAFTFIRYLRRLCSIWPGGLFSASGDPK